VNARAKETARTQGKTLEAFVTETVETYAAGTPQAPPGGVQRRDPMRVKLSVPDAVWDAGRARAAAEGTTLTEAVVGLLEMEQ
jgi:hypothetical protein